MTKPSFELDNHISAQAAKLYLERNMAAIDAVLEVMDKRRVNTLKFVQQQEGRRKVLELGGRALMAAEVLRAIDQQR